MKYTFLIIVLVFIGQNVFGMQQQESGKSSSQIIGRVVAAKGVIIIQEGSGGTQQIIKDVASIEDLQCLQLNGKTYGVNLYRDGEKINGNFRGYPIDQPDFKLSTTESTITFKENTFSYDGKSMCYIKDNQLIVGQGSSSPRPVTRKNNNTTPSYLSSTVKYVVFGGLIPGASLLVAGGICSYLSQSLQKTTA